MSSIKIALIREYTRSNGKRVLSDRAIDQIVESIAEQTQPDQCSAKPQAKPVADSAFYKVHKARRLRQLRRSQDALSTPHSGHRVFEASVGLLRHLGGHAVVTAVFGLALTVGQIANALRHRVVLLIRQFVVVGH